MVRLNVNALVASDSVIITVSPQFDNAVFVYGQKPNATMLATYDVWNNKVVKYLKQIKKRYKSTKSVHTKQMHLNTCYVCTSKALKEMSSKAYSPCVNLKIFDEKSSLGYFVAWRLFKKDSNSGNADIYTWFLDNLNFLITFFEKEITEPNVENIIKYKVSFRNIKKRLS